MNNIKNGMVTLGWYCLLAAITFLLAPWVEKTAASVLYIIALVVSLLIWYESLYVDLRKGIQQSLATMSFFIIPSLIISLGRYLLVAGDEYWKIVYEFFHGPFISGLTPIMNMSARPVLTILLPSLIILALFFFRLIKHIIRENSWQKTPYIY